MHALFRRFSLFCINNYIQLNFMSAIWNLVRRNFDYNRTNFKLSFMFQLMVQDPAKQSQPEENC